MGRPKIAPIPFELSPRKVMHYGPDWRYVRAGELAAALRTRRTPLYTDDAPTLAAVDHLKAQAGHRPAGPVDPVLAAAEAVYHAAGPTRWLYEAHVLARRPTGEAAERAGLAADVAAAYEALFFDVRDRLDARDWVRQWVFWSKPAAVPPPGDDGEVWRWFGYFGGPYVLDEVVAVTRHPDVPHPRRAMIERTIAAVRLPAGVPPRLLDQLHLRVMADQIGAGPAAYHVGRPGRSAKKADRRQAQTEADTKQGDSTADNSQAKTVPAGAATE